MTQKKNKIFRLSFLSLLLPVVLSVVALASIQSASALSGSEFSPGRIIDNGVFENKSSMGVDQIQRFLDSKVPVCDTQGQKLIYDSDYRDTVTRATYGSRIRLTGSLAGQPRNGNAPYTCLKDYRENGKSAAQIIFEAGQQYNINPQVLIVLLQKEQTLITDDWPWQIKYRSATGYGCPDTAVCDSQYYGFYNQVNNAARQFRRYMTYPNNYNYVAGTSNYIQWSPKAGCGGSQVTISNTATAALYNYTPYRPNQAALNNLYGEGDDCSAYGNRNFWRYFRDWFGSVYADPFMWQNTDLYVLDEGKNTEMVTDYLHKGERLFVVVKGVNLGTETWYRDGVNPARLGLWNPRDGASKYCDVQWLQISTHCNRSARLVEESVPTGGTFHYEMYMHAPNEGGEFREYFKPVLEDRAWMTNDTGFHIYVNSTDYYNWQWLYFDVWTDRSKTTRVNLDDLAKNQQMYIELKVKNKSATVWTNSGNNPTRLGTQNPQDHFSPLCTSDWTTCNRPATLQESSVKPGQTGTFGFTIKAPSTNGPSRFYVKPVIEYKGWMRGDQNHIYFNVTH